jgi:membrane protein implicated in regulation of membrane protease activity
VRRHHLIVLIPVLVTAAFVGWVIAAPDSVPTPLTVAVLTLGPSAFVGAALWRRWRTRRNQPHA